MNHYSNTLKNRLRRIVTTLIHTRTPSGQRLMPVPTRIPHCLATAFQGSFSYSRTLHWRWQLHHPYEIPVRQALT